MLALYMLIYICVKGGFEAPDRNGKTFVPRFTLSRDKPYVVVTETCQNTPICECLFTYGFSKQYPTVSEYSNELRAALCSLCSRGNRVIFAFNRNKKLQSKFSQKLPSVPSERENGKPQIFIKAVGSQKSGKHPRRGTAISKVSGSDFPKSALPQKFNFTK